MVSVLGGSFFKVKVAVFNAYIQFYLMVLGLRFMAPSEVKNRNPKKRTPQNRTHIKSMIDSPAPNIKSSLGTIGVSEGLNYKHLTISNLHSRNTILYLCKCTLLFLGCRGVTQLRVLYRSCYSRPH